MAKNLYETLEIQKFATASEISQRVDELLGKQLSPSQEEAMAILCNHQKRAISVSYTHLTLPTI